VHYPRDLKQEDFPIYHDGRTSPKCPHRHHACLRLRKPKEKSHLPNDQPEAQAHSKRGPERRFRPRPKCFLAEENISSSNDLRGVANFCSNLWIACNVLPPTWQEHQTQRCLDAKMTLSWINPKEARHPCVG
jgi:hypothetical protein